MNTLLQPAFRSACDLRKQMTLRQTNTTEGKQSIMSERKRVRRNLRFTSELDPVTSCRVSSGENHQCCSEAQVEVCMARVTAVSARGRQRGEK